ncbi:hypothetical protein [Euzebya sp.]|uniref:hypothetical protein n=1 Tax=Euzebya sp. TaxID=1971409 RepID=UPI003513D53F
MEGDARGRPGFARAVIDRLEPVFAPQGFPVQRSNADDRSVLFHCDGPLVGVVRRRCPTWFGDVAARSGDDPGLCLDLWVQVGDDGWYADLEGVQDGELAAAVGVGAVARLQALRTGGLHPWLDQVAVVYGGFLDAQVEHPEVTVDRP